MGSDDGAKKAKEMVVGPDGMPDMTGAKPGSFAPMLLGFTFIPLAIGLAIASAIYKYGSTGAYDSNMKTIIEKDMHWVYLAVVVFGRMIVFVNIVPMAYKSKVCALVTVCRVRVRSVSDWPHQLASRYQSRGGRASATLTRCWACLGAGVSLGARRERRHGRARPRSVRAGHLLVVAAGVRAWPRAKHGARGTRRPRTGTRGTWGCVRCAHGDSRCRPRR